LADPARLDEAIHRPGLCGNLGARLWLSALAARRAAGRDQASRSSATKKVMLVQYKPIKPSLIPSAIILVVVVLVFLAVYFFMPG
jgi:hypothetical protein